MRRGCASVSGSGGPGELHGSCGITASAVSSIDEARVGIGVADPVGAPSEADGTALIRWLLPA